MSIRAEITDCTFNKAMELYCANTPVSVISRELGCSYNAIYKRLKKEFPTVRAGKKDKLQKRAIELREAGVAIREIAKQLNAPRSTVRRWVGGVELTKEQKTKIREQWHKKISIIFKDNNNRRKKEREIRDQISFEKGRTLARDNDAFRIICALYWGEGGKTRRAFTFTNSDPKMVFLVASWLVSNGYQYKAQLKYHKDDHPDDAVLRVWWAKFLPDMKIDNFFASCIKSRSEVKPARLLPHGTITLSVYKADLFYQVMGGIDFLGNIAYSKV
jgi:transposase-like protein